MKKYSAAIIGCGKVAGMYGHSRDKSIQSHAQAYQNNTRTELKAAFDIDHERLDKFCSKWGIDAGYSSIQDMMAAEKPEIVSICSPTEYHLEHFMYLSDQPIKAVFAEKPLANDIDHSKEIVKLTKEMIVAVNYFRRWNSDFLILKKDILEDKYGKVEKIICHHTKGIKNNGSHIIDLLSWFFGSLNLDKVIKKYEKLDDDLGVDCLLTSNSGFPIILSHIPKVDYVYIEIEIICSDAVIKITQRGQNISIFHRETDPDYKVFNRTSLSSESQTNWNNCFEKAITNIISCIENGDEILCTPNDALKISILCERIITA
tara:strand:- start:3275 stop:4225 length:951 start_codon:yes stop_codon:yes gene_type:complete